MKKAILKAFSLMLVAVCLTACSNDNGKNDKEVTTTVATNQTTLTTTAPTETTTETPTTVVTTTTVEETTISEVTTTPQTSETKTETETSTTTKIETTTTVSTTTTKKPTVTTTTTKKATTTTTTTAKKTTTTTKKQTTTTAPKTTTTVTTTAFQPYYDYEGAEGICELVNELRTEWGRDELEVNEALMEAARVRAKELSESFSHTRPNGTGGTSVIREYLQGSWYRGENIGMTNGGYEYMFTLFKESDGHMGTMVSSEYTMMGIGCYLTEDGVMYCCQLFVGPR